ncbi:MAG TPA: DUF423 domain-containing protein [Rhodothermales bacterium]
MSRQFVVAGCVFAGLAVVAGAFGAHALEPHLTPERLATYETAVRYQMYHALALLAAGWLSSRESSRLPGLAGILFIAGIAVFSGSLYLLVATDVRWWGAVTPIGGVAFIAGWICLAVGAARTR